MLVSRGYEHGTKKNTHDISLRPMIQSPAGKSSLDNIGHHSYIVMCKFEGKHTQSIL